MNIEQLEKVLYFFYDDRKWYKKFEQTYEYFEKEGFTKPEMLAILQKLTKDGYIIEEQIIVTTRDGQSGIIKERDSVSGWYMSFDGIFLIDTLPKKYTGRPYQYLKDIETKKKKTASMESFPKVYWWAVAIISALLTFTVTKLSAPKKIPQPTIILPKDTASNKTIINVATYDSSTKH